MAHMILKGIKSVGRYYFKTMGELYRPFIEAGVAPFI